MDDNKMSKTNNNDLQENIYKPDDEDIDISENEANEINYVSIFCL